VCASRLQCVAKVSGRFVEVVAQGAPCELLPPGRGKVDIGSVKVKHQGRRFLLKGEIIRLRPGFMVSTSILLKVGRIPKTLLPLASCQEAGGTMCMVTFLSRDAEQRTLFRRRPKAKWSDSYWPGKQCIFVALFPPLLAAERTSRAKLAQSVTHVTHRSAHNVTTCNYSRAQQGL
jgi:hypothetical protein